MNSNLSTCTPIPYLSSISKSNLHVYHPHLSLNTHFKKHTSSIKTTSLSYKTRTKASCNRIQAALVHTKETFYDMLGVPESGTFSEIKEAYKQLALKYHPDVSPPDCIEEYTRKFIQVQEAYQILSDPNSRVVYDNSISHSLNPRRSVQKRWQSQVMELNKRSIDNESSGINVSWGNRMRKNRRN